MTLLFDGDYLEDAIDRFSLKVKSYLKDEVSHNVIFIGILTNGVFLAKRVQNKLHDLNYTVLNPVMELDISLYRDDLGSKKDYINMGSSTIEMNLDNKHVILFDDVLSTARTARAALNAIFDYGRPKKVSFVVLFDRNNRQVPIEPNVVGQDVDVDVNLRVNVEFFEVVGDDQVVLGSMK